jgi:hypothetical protein
MFIIIFHTEMEVTTVNETENTTHIKQSFHFHIKLGDEWGGSPNNVTL